MLHFNGRNILIYTINSFMLKYFAIYGSSYKLHSSFTVYILSDKYLFTKAWILIFHKPSYSESMAYPVART